MGLVGRGILALAGRVVVGAIERLGAMPPEVLLGERGLLRVLRQVFLEGPAAALVAGLLDLALQLALQSFVITSRHGERAPGERYGEDVNPSSLRCRSLLSGRPPRS